MSSSRSEAADAAKGVSFHVGVSRSQRVAAHLGFCYGMLAFFVCFLLFCVPAIVVSFGSERGGARRAYFTIGLWAKLFSLLIGIRYRVTQTPGFQRLLAENEKGGRPFIYVVNHGSYLDAITIAAAFPRNYRPLGKIEFARIPIFGAMYRRVAITVDRASPESRGRSVAELMTTLKKGVSILIFPEGTMNRTRLPLQPFKSGAFRIAKESGLPLVPTVIRGAREHMPRTQKFFLRLGGTIDVHFGEPVLVTPSSTVESLQVEAAAKMEPLLR